MEYKNKSVFLRKSKKGNHLYAFFEDGSSMVMSVDEVDELIEDAREYVKVGLLEKKNE